MGYRCPSFNFVGSVASKSHSNSFCKACKDLFEGGITIKSANANSIEFGGYVEFDFQLSPDSKILEVPILLKLKDQKLVIMPQIIWVKRLMN